MTEQNGLAPEQVRVLMKNLNSNRIAHRSQGGAQLSYLEAYDVKATLIRMFGFGGFSAETVETSILFERPYVKDGKDMVQITALCTVRLTIHCTGAVYQESGAASQSGADYGEVADFAIKTAESDALKRAATYLGTQFGLSLYNKGATADVVRVLIEPNQASYLDAPGASVTDRAVERLQDSLGATVVDSGPDSASAGEDSGEAPEWTTSPEGNESGGPVDDGVIRTTEQASEAVIKAAASKGTVVRRGSGS